MASNNVVEDFMVGPLGFFTFKYLSFAIGVLSGFILAGNGMTHNIYGACAITAILFIVGTTPLIRMLAWPFALACIMYSLLFDPLLVYSFVTFDTRVLFGIPVGWIYIGLGIWGADSIVRAGVYQNNLGTIVGATALSFLLGRGDNDD